MTSGDFNFLILLCAMLKTRFALYTILPIILLNLLFPTRSASQQSISLAYNFGEIYPHNTDIKPMVKDPVRGFTVNYYFPNTWGEEWRNYFNHPNSGLSFNYKSYGNPEVVGNSFSLSTFFQMSVLPRRKYFDIGFLMYAGLGYITKIYDEVENPTNLAISTHMNITADLRYYAKIRFHPVYLEYSRGLNHFSNGLIKAPNLGINVKNNNITLGYEFEDQPVHKKIPKAERNKEPRHEIWVYGATGVKEVSGIPGKRYVPVNGSINYTYRTTVINKMGVGLDFVYDPSLEDYAFLTYEGYQGEPALNFRSGISLHNEFVFRHTGLFTSYGFNFTSNEFYARQRYYKVGLKFYYKNLIGVVLLRAIPLFRADLLELGVGYRIPVKSKKAKNEN